MYLVGCTVDYLVDCTAVRSQVGYTVVGRNLVGILRFADQASVDLEDSSEPDSLELGIPELDSLEPADLVLDSRVLDMLAHLEAWVFHDMELVMDRFDLDLHSGLVYAPGGLVERKSGL